MNFVKKTLIMLLVLTLLASTFVLFSSAESSDGRSAEEIAGGLLEQFSPVYAQERYDDKVLENANDTLEYKGATFSDTYNYQMQTKYITSSIEYEEGTENKVLALKSIATAKRSGYVAKYELYGNKAKTDRISDKIVITFDVKVSDANKDGCYFRIAFNEGEYFRIDFTSSDKTVAKPNVKYTTYIQSGKYITDKSYVVDGMTPEFDKWYTIEAVMNFSENGFVVDVFEKDNPANRVSTGLHEFFPEACDIIDDSGKPGPNTVELGVYSIAKNSVTQAFLDNFCVYEGSGVRDLSGDPVDYVDNALLLLDQMAKSSKTSVEDKMIIANLYNDLFFDEEIGICYDPAAAEIAAIKAGAKSFINHAHAGMLISNTDKLEQNAVVGYHERLALYNETEMYNDFFPDEETELSAIEGISDVVDAILHAKQIYKEELIKSERVKEESVRFVNLVAAFDYDSRNFEYIKSYVSALEDCANVDGTFKFAEMQEITDEDDAKYKYQTVSVAIEEYNAIKSKFSQIENDAYSFINFVNQMTDNPQRLVGFAELYANYNNAKAVITESVFTSEIDVKTYPLVNGVSLTSCIEKYYRIEEYVNSRVEEALQFIDYVNAADSLALHGDKVLFIDLAASYIDNDVDNKSAELDYPGVRDAIVTYNNVVKQISDNIAASDAYKAAVAAIDMSASHAKLKADVAAAMLLKEAGAVVGIDGVMEANIKLLEAETKIETAEGNSATLKAAVAALKDAKTFAERRELLFIAKNASAGATDEIDGVTAAKATLAAEIEKFNGDVASANAGFSTSIKNAADISSYTVASAIVYKMADIIKALWK